MKKVCSLILCVVLVCTMCAGVFAEEASLTLSEVLGVEKAEAKAISFVKGDRAYESEEGSIVGLFFEFADKILVEEQAEPKELADDGYHISIVLADDTAKSLYVSLDGEIDLYDVEPEGAHKGLYAAVSPETVIELMKIFMPENETVLQVSGWATEVVERAYAEGFIPVTLGISDYTQPISREKFCELAMALLTKCGIQAESVEEPFADTDSTTVAALYNLGIINGKSETEFAPNDLLSRQEAATILCRASEKMGKAFAATLDEFVFNDDSLIADWAKTQVYTMRAMGIMQGVSDVEFSPLGTYTAEQAVATMVRLFDAQA